MKKEMRKQSHGSLVVNLPADVQQSAASLTLCLFFLLPRPLSRRMWEDRYGSF